MIRTLSLFSGGGGLDIGFEEAGFQILTTSSQHEPLKDVIEEVDNVKKLLGTQMIVNGVIPTIKYYLRLLTNPSSVLPIYVKSLTQDTAIGFEHRDVWNKIATGTIS